MAVKTGHEPGQEAKGLLSFLFTADAVHIYAVVRLNRLLQLYRMVSVTLIFNFTLFEVA